MRTTEMEYNGIMYQRYQNTPTGEYVRWKMGNQRVYDELGGGRWIEWNTEGMWKPCDEPDIEKHFKINNAMNNFQESMTKLEILNDLTKKHIEQMENDYLSSKGGKVGDIIQYKGYSSYEGPDTTIYGIITNMECELITNTKYNDPNVSEMENRFHLFIQTNDILNSGVSKRTNYHMFKDYKVICSQDRLKEICKEMGIRYELNRKTLKKIADITIESL